MTHLLGFFILISSISLAADNKIKMYFNNEEITKIIEIYSKASGQTFIVDPGVRGKISIFNQDSVDLSEAYNQLSTALAVNGYAISKQDNTFLVKPARAIQRDLIEVTTETPTLKPERMVTWIVTVHHLSAKVILRELRMLASRDGDIALSTQSNQLVVIDWASNINKLSELFKQLDKPVDPKLSKFIEQSKKSE